MTKCNGFLKCWCIIFAAMLCLCGCGKKNTEEPVEITLMHGWGGTPQTHKIMQEIYDEFDRQNTDIELNCIPYSDNTTAVEKANDMLAVGKVPDILSTNGLSYYISNAVKCGEALDLMPYIERDTEWKKQIHPAVFDTWQTEDGELYTIPDALEVAGYWYNREYLIQAGITDDEGNPALPETWEEFIQMLDQLQNWIDSTGRSITVFALEDEQITEFVFLARLAGDSQKGLLAAMDTQPQLNNELFSNTLNDIETMYQYSQKVNSIEDARQCFHSGSSIIYFNGVWEADELEKSTLSEQFQYANYPTYDGQSLSYVSPSSGYVLSGKMDDRKSEAAIRFLKYMLSEEVQEIIALETRQAPSNPNIDKSDITEESPLLGMALDVADSADIQIATVRSVWSDEQIDRISQALKQ